MNLCGRGKYNRFYERTGNKKDGNGSIRWEEKGGTGLREGIRGETARIKVYWRDGMETQCSGNVLKYMKAILMDPVSK